MHALKAVLLNAPKRRLKWCFLSKKTECLLSLKAPVRVYSPVLCVCVQISVCTCTSFLLATHKHTPSIKSPLCSLKWKKKCYSTANCCRIQTQGRRDCLPYRTYICAQLIPDEWVASIRIWHDNFLLVCEDHAHTRLIHANKWVVSLATRGILQLYEWQIQCMCCFSSHMSLLLWCLGIECKRARHKDWLIWFEYACCQVPMETTGKQQVKRLHNVPIFFSPSLLFSQVLSCYRHHTVCMKVKVHFSVFSSKMTCSLFLGLNSKYTSPLERGRWAPLATVPWRFSFPLLPSQL